MWLAIAVFVGVGIVYLDDPIDGDWTARWTASRWRDGDSATFESHERGGVHYLRTATDARFYALSRPLDAPASTVGRPLVVQYRTGSPQVIDCGGTYIKLLGADGAATTLTSDTPYRIMFGPDVCGGTRRVHLILQHNGSNHERTEPLAPPSDTRVHSYTAVLHPNASYEIFIDASRAAHGELRDHWPFLPPKQIDDPNVSKPNDWVDEKQIDDPEAVKPDGWDAPELVIDHESSMPEDWNAEEDGEWEAPMKKNPEFKGEWRPPKIDNPAYRGQWVHPQIANPEYIDDETIGRYSDISYVAIEVWQVKSGSLFGGFFVGDDASEALRRASSFKDEDEAEPAAATASDGADLPVDGKDEL